MNTNHLDERSLDLLSLGSASAADTSRWQAHVAACGACRERLEERRELREHFEREVLPRTLGKVRARLTEEKKPWLRNVLPWLLPLAASAALALLFLRPQGDVQAPDAALEPDLRIKGGATLQLFVKRGEQVFEAKDGDALHPGDAVRFVIWPGAAKSLVVGSVDGAGHASIYHPQQGEQSSHVQPNQRFKSPMSITLDAAPGPERVFAVLSDEPVPLARVREALTELGRRGPNAIRAARALPIAHTTQATRLFEKSMTTP